MKKLDLLKAIFVASLESKGVTRVGLLRSLDVSERELAKSLGSLKKEGLLEIASPGVRLTAKGRRKLRVVFIGGTFEVIHPGHLYTIQQAKRLGDVLVVVVARDATVRKRKNREPLTLEEERVKVVGAMRQVDAAILGSETNIYDTLERVRPDVVAVGYDQSHKEEEIALEAKSRGIKLSVVRLGSANPSLKTSKILAQLSS
jgi:FAD synthetase